MGADLMVEGSYDPSRVMTRLRLHGGKAVLNFLLALNWFCDIDDSKEMDEKSSEWFIYLQDQIGQPLANVFKPMLDCMWGDDGWFEWNYLEDEYEWYLKRNKQLETKLTEAEFRKWITESVKHWSPVDSITAITKLLIDTFKAEGFREKDGQFTPQELTEYVIPAFESLYNTLNILKKYDSEIVRLTFY